MKIGDTEYKVTYNQSLLTFNGKNLKNLLKNILVFTDASGNVKEIKSISVKNPKQAGKLVINRIKFADGTVLKKSALSALDIEVAAREVSTESTENANGAVVYAKAKSAKVSRNNRKLTLKLEVAEWNKNAKDASRDNVKRFKTVKVANGDIESLEVKDKTITIKFKRNYTGTITMPVK